MDPTDVLGFLVFPCDNHANGHNMASVDTFGGKGNDHSVSPEVRANGLSDAAGLGLLSEGVGLLQSCIDFQEVIKFLMLPGEPLWRQHIN